MKKRSTTYILKAVSAAMLLMPSVAFAASERVTPKLTIDIPSIKFSGVTTNGNFLSLPWLAEYIYGVHIYLIGVAAFLAAVFMVIGGLQITYAGGNASTVSSGRSKIKNALAGLVIAAASTMILYAVNPDLTNPSSIAIEAVPSRPLNLLNDRYGANSEAIDNLREAISEMTPEEQAAAQAVIQRATEPINMDLPRNCPGRDPSHDTSAWLKVGGKNIAPLKNYTITSNGKTLDENAIQFWLEEQRRTGVPAGVMIAQMLTETGNPGKCAAVNPTSAASCGGEAARNYNFGGVGCTNRQVPNGCGHAAFTVGAFDVNTRSPYNGASCSDANRGLGAACQQICESSSGQQVKFDCGPTCYPQPSHFSRSIGGQEIWFKSLQCSRRFGSMSEFLDSHLGFVKFCLPYNDSVYKFAYCIGASTYAGATGSKATVLAQIIERNCLCDPATDSLGCERNLELEDKLAKGLIKKRNLNLFATECEVERKKTGSAFSIGACAKQKAGSGIDYLGIIQAFRESTGGLLDVAPPQDDLGLSVLGEE